MYVLKTRSFAEDPKKEIWGNQRFWAYEVFLRPSTFSTTLQDVGILPTLILFPPFTLILGGLFCRCSKGLFGLFLDIYGRFLWLFCGWFNGLNFECLWNVQMIVLRVVWGQFYGRCKGLFGWFYGLI